MANETGWEYETKSIIQDSIKEAITTSIYEVVSSYGFQIFEDRMICCPFPSHKGGKERTPSLYLYRETNSYYCFGCKSSRTTVDFVSALEEISRQEAAKKILSKNFSVIIVQKEFDETKISQLNLSFSKFLKPYIKDPEYIEDIEKYCESFDALNIKHKLSHEDLEKVIELIKNTIIEKYGVL